MNEESGSKRQSIHLSDFNLKLVTVTPLYTLEPSEYVTEFQGQIILEDWPDDDSDLGASFRVRAGRITLSLYHLARARDEGQDPWEVFDCMSEAALGFYDDIYEGFELRPEALKATGLAGILNPSLLVIEAVELLPGFRGHGLGLGAALKAMHVLTPANGLAALLAAPLQFPVQEQADQARWRRLMKMDALEPDSPDVREKLGRYWARLGFERIGPASSNRYLRSLETPLPTLAEAVAGLKKH
jgi:hypothetical protein